MLQLVVIGLSLSIVIITLGNMFYPRIPNATSECNAPAATVKEDCNDASFIASTEEPSFSFEDVNWVKVVDKLIFVLLVVALLYFSAQTYDGGFLRIIAGMFPREFKTLGFDKLLAEDVGKVVEKPVPHVVASQSHEF